MLHNEMMPELVLYDDAELGNLLGDRVVSRETIGMWPLSWAQHVTLSSGTQYAYKAMLPPLVEAVFYESTESTLLPNHIQSGTFDTCSTLLIEWIDRPALSDLCLSADELVSHARRVVDQVGALPSDLPVYLDLGSSDKWTQEAQQTVGKLQRLITNGRFTSVPNDVVSGLDHWLMSGPVLERVNETSGLVHRDLKLAHIFPTDDGCDKVIDWQVPAIAPRAVDLVGLLQEAGIDALSYVDPSDFGIAAFLHLRWAVVAQHDFFPDSRFPLFNDWAASAIESLHRVWKL